VTIVIAVLPLAALGLIELISRPIAAAPAPLRPAGDTGLATVNEFR
jgi:hypothetical protein